MVIKKFDLGATGHAIRIWTDPDLPVADVDADMCVEWTGRAGHPTSYAMIGGELSSGSDLDIQIGRQAGQWRESLAGRADHVQFGLPDEYLDAVSAGSGPGLKVTVAAHGLEGSSPVAFYWVTKMLMSMLSEPNFGESHVSQTWKVICEGSLP